MIDDYEAYNLIQSHEMSYYDFQKWMVDQRSNLDKEVWQEAYDEGYSAGMDDGYSQGYDDGMCEA